ncbi:hypothetical protein V0R47_00005, partial [Pseudomonas aeruginosa]|uniref:hypothetical protein n=1 Tax=Pseudomonas aeruginosa TaxID=287 RepID=UPI002E7B3E4A
MSSLTFLSFYVPPPLCGAQNKDFWSLVRCEPGPPRGGAATACVPRGERRIAMADGDGSQCALDP